MNEILLVEDNRELASLLKAFLHKEGFSCIHKECAEEAQLYLMKHQPSLILLDIMLPKMDGFAFCKYVRRTSNVAIVILSAKSAKPDKLMGYELGADDYMEKPIDLDLLLAKIKALQARTNKREDRIVSGALTIEKQAHKVYLHEKLIDLNVKEFELLLLLVENKGKTLSKEYLFGCVWGMDSNSENQTLTVHIKMLRSKIETDSRNPKRIQTIWGIGYRYEEV